MIPLHTPPGTKIVCVDAAIDNGRYMSMPPGWRTVGGMDGLKAGAAYTVAGWEDHPIGGFVVCLKEIQRDNSLVCYGGFRTNGFSPRRFRLAELPRCLTELLKSETKPVGVKELDVERVMQWVD